MDPNNIKRILAATDFSEVSAEAVDTAIQLARALDATVDLVHVTPEIAIATPPPVDFVALPLDPAAAVDEASRKMADEERHARERGVSCESNVLVGRPDAAIVAHADETSADLIVIATHQREGITHALLGSTAERVVQHAHCPVLTVPQRRQPQI
ncbi:MAG TPA: universal stress protein [Polyangia bacterium]|nr:universal stress protein [Polyangia bacterium]